MSGGWGRGGGGGVWEANLPIVSVYITTFYSFEGHFIVNLVQVRGGDPLESDSILAVVIWTMTSKQLCTN